jgi:hypothetical protein
MRLDFTTQRRWITDLLGIGRELSGRSRIIVAASLFVVSFAVKSLHAVDLAPYTHTRSLPFAGLTDRYDRRARQINDGKGILVPVGQNPRDTGLLSHAPGYSVFLGTIYGAAGRSFFSVQALQNLLNSLSPVMIFLCGGILVSWRVGSMAGALAAISHHFSYYSNLILPDSLCALPIITGIYVVSRAKDFSRGGWAFPALAGAMFGVSTWLRPNAMMFSVFLAAFLFLISAVRRRILSRLLVMVIVSWVVVAPITIRNYLIYGEFVPVQIGVGLNFWEGIGEAGGEKFGAVAKDEEVAAQEALIYDNPDYGGWWASPDGIQRDRDRVKKSLAVIARNPVWYASVMLDRMAEMVKYSAHAPLVHRAGDVKPPPDGGVIEGLEEASRAALVLGESISFLRPAARAAQRLAKETALVFLLLGLVLMPALDRRKTALLLIVPGYYLLVQSWIHTEFRYILPMHYFLFVFAAMVWVLIGGAVVIVAKRIRRKPPAGEPGEEPSHGSQEDAGGFRNEHGMR